MLHNFRVNAGLAPKAPVYGGWESVEPWIEIRCHGHTLGHYLTAAACMYRVHGRRALRRARRLHRRRARRVPGEDAAAGSTAFPDGVAPLIDSLAGKDLRRRALVHDAQGVGRACATRTCIAAASQALDVLVKFADWVDRASARRDRRPLPEDARPRARRHERGVRRPVRDHAADAALSRARACASRIARCSIRSPQGVDKLDGLHSNTQIPKVDRLQPHRRRDGAPRITAAPRDSSGRPSSTTRSFATGGHGDVEHFFPKDEFAEHLRSGKTMETCCTHNMLRLTRSLYARDPRVAYFDYFERALFNGILASQDPDDGHERPTSSRRGRATCGSITRRSIRSGAARARASRTTRATASPSTRTTPTRCT